ncbi:MAG: ATP-binding protein, partial [Anaerolineae bacterium]
MTDPERTLRLTFHGRIIDQLGIQMYQSPVAAVAELVANAWDADAELVQIDLPADLGEDAELTIKDDGIGMT